MGRGIDAERKWAAVLALIRREEPASAIARRYGMSETALYRFREQFLEGGKTALSSGKDRKSNSKVPQLECDVAERDRVIGELTIANRILKKSQDGLL